MLVITRGYIGYLIELDDGNNFHRTPLYIYIYIYIYIFEGKNYHGFPVFRFSQQNQGLVSLSHDLGILDITQNSSHLVDH